MSSAENRKAGVSRWLARGSHLRHGAQPVKRRSPVTEIETCPRCGVPREKWERGHWKYATDGNTATFFHLRCPR